ncbi:HAD family hydrolase [uncultured Parvimonas sp.]|uniref:HAD family hydrolase n=1 Tax=uncultured Parvimonas sp. TaxID=747372 RepID=UPI00259228E8|nr:HAD family hydrolase [uncultured Parvimonas sp.]
MYKLIALDMDGTTFNEEHRISDVVKDALFYAMEKGVKIAFISGREEFTIKQTLEELKIDIYYGALNGSLISTTYSKVPKFVKSLNKEYLFDILDTIEKNDLTPIVFLENLIFTNDSNDEYVEIISKFINPKIVRVKSVKEYILENNLEEKVLKIGICQEYDVLKILEEKFSDTIKSEYTLAFSLPFFFELMAKDTDKGSCLREICRLNDIELSETIAIGDGENDIPMLNISGLSIAMGNAMENVKKNVDYITDTNKNDGVAKSIRKFI